MIIIAKFQSNCPYCGKDIRVGEKVEWTRKTYAMHVECRRKERELARERRTVTRGK